VSLIFSVAACYLVIERAPVRFRVLLHSPLELDLKEYQRYDQRLLGLRPHLPPYRTAAPWQNRVLLLCVAFCLLVLFRLSHRYSEQVSTWMALVRDAKSVPDIIKINKLFG
jgi:hypothetical protein